MAKRNLGFDHEDTCRRRGLIPGFHLYITQINSKRQTSYLFSLKKVELMLLLAILKRLKSFGWFLSCLLN